LIKVNIISGFLGVGKTTVIQHLIANKPVSEKWAILINEFGLVSIDHSAFEENDGLKIKEVAGGCVCCSASLPMQITMNRIINEIKPDRIIIEPTGLGHPANIIDLLRDESYSPHLTIQGMITIVNPAHFESERHLQNGTWQDQITLADVIVVNKCDVATSIQKHFFNEYINRSFPKKQEIVETEFGKIGTPLLDYQLFNTNPSSPHQHNHSHERISDSYPKRYEADGFGSYTAGWIYDKNEVFDLNKVKELFADLKTIDRIKGVFRTSVEWFLVQKADSRITSQYIAYRKDSRVEFISSYPEKWLEIEEKLKKLIVKNQ
jgi:G3E family GTPase